MTSCSVTPAKVQKVENEEAGGDVASGGEGTGADEPGIVNKKDFRELTETPKLLPKPTRHVQQSQLPQATTWGWGGWHPCNHPSSTTHAKDANVH